MSPERTKELLRILSDSSDSNEDLQQFILTYCHELDEDFLKAVAAVVQDAIEKGKEDDAGFAAEHQNEYDDVYFAALREYAKRLWDQGEKETSRYLDKTGQALQAICQNLKEARGRAVDVLAEIDAEDDGIRQLRETDPNESYERARINLERARQTRNDTLIMHCAFNLGYSAAAYSPYPKLEDAVDAYSLAAEKARVIADNEAYSGIQVNLGNAYSNLSTGDRTQNLNKAIACFENALRVYGEQDYPEDYAMTQNNLGNAYSDLPTYNRGQNLIKAIACYNNALRIYADGDYQQDYAMTLNSLGNVYSNLPTGDPTQNLRNAITCYNSALTVYSEQDYPEDYAMIQYNLGNTQSELLTLDGVDNLWTVIDCFEKALRIYKEQDHPVDYAMTQNNLGIVYYTFTTQDRDDNLRKAIICFESALRVYSEQNHPSNYAKTHSNLGAAYLVLSTGNRTENLRIAMACFNNALKIYTKYTHPKEYAKTQNYIGLVYSNLPIGRRAENLRNSIACYENALIIYGEQDDSEGLAMTQNNLGNAYSHLPTGNRTKNLWMAIACYENALRIYGEQDYPEDYAGTQHNLANAYADLPKGDRTQNLRKAIAYYRNALDVYNEQDYPLDYALTQNNLGTAYSNLPTGDRAQNLRKAIACFNNASRIYSEQDYPENYAHTQDSLGSTYSDILTGDRSENLWMAIACYENALRIYGEQDYPEDFAGTQNNLGTAYSNLPTGDRAENLKKAIACFINTLRIYVEQDYPQDYARTQNNLGTAYSEVPTGDRSENLWMAIACYENALRIYSEQDYPEDYAGTQNNLGAAYADLPTGDQDENLEKAIDCYQNALRIYGEQDYPEDYSGTQNNLGNAYSKLQSENPVEKVEKTVACYENALKVRTTEQFPQKQVDTLYNLAQACDNDAFKDRHRAYGACAEAIDILEKHVRAVSSAQTRRALAETQARVYHHMVSLCVRLGKTAEALSYAERGKSRTLVEMLHSAQLQPSENVPKEMRDIFVAARAKLEELDYRRHAGESTIPRDFEIGEDAEQKVVFRSLPVTDSSQREDIWRLREEMQRVYDLLLEEIRRVDHEFAASERVQPLCVSDIEALIPERTLFVECFTGYDGTFIFVLDGKTDISDTQVFLKDLTYAELFNELVLRNWFYPYYSFQDETTKENEQAWFHALENTPQLLAKKFWHAKDERDRSLAMIVERSGAERIVFFPHSGLHLLPLHLMPLAEDRPEQRLMDRYEVVYAPSASMLRFTLNRPEHPLDRLLAVANPDHSLKFSDSEVMSISNRFNQHQVLWHDKATRDAVLTGADQANIVHFSCHGAFTSKNPLDSHLVLAGENLSLREIFSKLKLPRAQAVLLPACETGMVQMEQGDEYLGLASGFLHAGALSVISSLWAVNDLPTSLLMQRWYENVLTNKMGKAAALREAQQWVRNMKTRDIRPILDTLVEDTEKQPQADVEKVLFLKVRRKIYRDMPDDEHPFAHPYYWGGFVCTGNWN